MSIRPLRSLIPMALAAVLSLAQPLLARAADPITCGSVLGPGGSYVLDHDLTCRAKTKPDGKGILTVLQGATLDLDGHTVACANKGWGIRVVGATLLNGTVRGCQVGVRPWESVVKHLRLTENTVGVLIAQESNGGNLIIGNVATHGSTGFFEQEEVIRASTFVDNVAADNDFAGFLFWASPRSVLIGNVAARNGGDGFAVWQVGQMSGNVARKNGGAGFRGVIFGEGLVGNVAKKNKGAGFALRSSSNRISDNVATANGGDGFSFDLEPFACDECPPATVTDNYALDNGGNGLAVLYEREPMPPAITITNNVAIGQRAPHFDLADGDPTCRGAVWQHNTFDTASQSCIE